MLHDWYARLRDLVHKFIVVSSPLIFLAACSQGSFMQPSGETNNSTEGNLLLSKVGQLQQGHSLKLHDPEYGGPLKVTVLDSYFSAAGVDCKRLLVETTTESRQLLFCRKPKGGWSAVPNIDQ